MWLVLTRAALPDAPQWPGRRLRALIDAVAWPAAWIALVTRLHGHAGIVGPVVIALALLCAVGRARTAGWENHRYRFTTWRWGKVLGAMLLIGAVMKLSMSA